MSEPHAVFRWLRREDRARYAEMMHATLAGQLRDLDRTASKAGGVIGEAVKADVARMRAELRKVGL